MSFSSYAENGQKSQIARFHHIQPRRLRTWVEDDKVNQCHQCGRTFGLFIRKHHCRVCGRIFCWECSKNSIQISPKLGMALRPYKNFAGGLVSYFREMTGKTTEKEMSQKHRVCDVCYRKHTHLKDMDIYIAIFRHLTIPDLHRASAVSTVWRQAALYVLSEIREIQYLPAHHRYTSLEKKVIWDHRKLFAGHGKWLLQLIRTVDWSILPVKMEVSKILRAKKTCNCWSMMCSRDCGRMVNPLDAMELFGHPNRLVIRYAIQCLKGVSPSELMDYIPVMVKCVAEDIDKLILDFLVSSAIQDEKFLSGVYWELSTYSKLECVEYFVNAIKEKMDERYFHKFHCARNLLWTLKTATHTNAFELYTYLQKKTVGTDLYCPFYPHEQAAKIIGVDVKNSYRKPIEVRMSVSDDTPQVESCVKRFIFKKDDVRKDQLIMNLIRICDAILKRDLNVDYGIVTYRVTPIDGNSGVIEVIDRAETVYHIRDQLHKSIQNHLIERNPTAQINELRGRFIKSTAAYCVISYLLGIGDRHLDNIMVTDDGYLFHIDFEYLLGRNPKPLCHEIRITREIIDAIGGHTSTYYKEFQRHCCQIYNCLRRYHNIFYEFFKIIPEYTVDEIERSVNHRFAPGEHSDEAEEQLTKIIENSNDNFGDAFMDLFHHYSRQSSFKDSVGEWLSSIHKMTRHVFNL